MTTLNKSYGELETLCEGTRWGIKSSKSNPGYYGINIPNPAALVRLGKAFPDMKEAAWLAADVAKGSVRESIGIEMDKEGPDHWAGWAWWEDKHGGLDIHVRRKFDGNGKYHLEVEISPMRGPGAHWTAKKPVKGKRTYRNINAKAEAVWGLRRYLDKLR